MSGAPRGWWHRNRWWLPAAPLALAAMLAASSIRIAPFWWENDFHRAFQQVPAGEWAAVRDSGQDALGPYERAFRVRVVEVRDMDPFEPPSSSPVQEVPDGSRAITARLEFEADPDELLSGCTVVFVGSDGTEYGGNQFNPFNQSQQCVPVKRPGPMPAIFESATERVVGPDEDRPSTWHTDPLMIVPEDARITALQIRYEPPDYLLLQVAP